jgi:hypothetical protein
MAKYEVIAGKVFWGIGTIFVALLLIVIASGVLNNHYPDFFRPAPTPIREPEREVGMPPLKNIKLVLGRDEVRNPGDRVKNALKECIGSSPVLIGTGRGARIEAFLADATESDIFYFHCSSPESWKMLAGRAGFVKIREGKPVDELILFMN